MRRWGWMGMVGLMAGCASTTAVQREVRSSFEAWMEAARAGDVERVLQGMSPGLRSEWVFRLLVSEDPEAQAWRTRLSGTSARTDLDLWLEHQKKYASGRPDLLPATVLSHPSLEPFLRECLSRERENLRDLFTGVSITEVYVDGTGATVLIRNRDKSLQMYALVPGPGGWRIDGCRGPLQSLPPR